MLIGSKGNTLLETIFVIGTLLVTVGVFAYTISTISSKIILVNFFNYKYIYETGMILEELN